MIINQFAQLSIINCQLSIALWPTYQLSIVNYQLPFGNHFANEAFSKGSRTLNVPLTNPHKRH